MATTAGWSQYVFMAIEEPSKKLDQLTVLEMKQFLRNWRIKFLPVEEIIKSKFLDAINTLFVLSGTDPDNELIANLTVEIINGIEIPEWIADMRNDGIPESDIQEIILKLGTVPTVIKMANERPTKKLTIQSPAKRVLESYIKKWNNGDRTTIRIDENIRQEVLGSDIHDSKEIDLNLPDVQTTPIYRRDSRLNTNTVQRVLDLNQESNHNPQEVNMVPVLPKAYSKLPVLPNHVKGMDPWGWLASIKRLLKVSRCHDDDKLYVLQRAMAYEFIPIAEELDQQEHTSVSYITALEEFLRDPSVMTQARSELVNLKYNFEVHPSEFIQKLKELTEKVKGSQKPECMIQDVLERIPEDTRNQMVRNRVISNLKDLSAALTHEYCVEKLRREREKRKANTSSPEKKEEKRTESINRSVARPNIKCYNCGLIGHTSRVCRKPKKTFDQSKANLKLVTPVTSNQPTYGQNNPVKKVENSNFISVSRMDLPQAPNPNDYSFMVNESQCELITRIDASIRNFPVVKLTLCQPDKKIVRVGEVLLDTGACTACIDYSLAIQLKAFIMSSNVSVRGIIGNSFQPVEGAAYAMFKHALADKPKIIKFQVMRNLEPLIVLGNRFADVFFAGMINHGGKYQVKLRDTADGEWMDPELLCRFCTPEESIGLIQLPEAPIVDTIEEKQRFLDSLGLPLDSPYSEEEKVPEQLNERIHFMQEIANESDNIYPIFLIQQNDLTLAERLINRMNPKLSSDMKNEMLETLMEFSDVFAKTKSDLGLVPWQRWPIKIDIGDNHVPYQRPYPCTVERRKEYRKIIEELMRNDIIEESDAEGGSPALLVPKPDGSFRLLNDLRAVNRLTKIIYHPMPRVDDCLEAIRGARYFNMFDLFQGYFQIEIPPSERGKTVFVTPDGKYQYKRLPMGLACAPFEFQRMMNTVLNGLNYTECLGYFDDIPVIGKSWKGLLNNTKLVLERLRDWNLKIKTDKCFFGETELILLGHLVDGRGIRPDPGKVAALKQLPYPKTVRQLQSILGCYNYFARYIPNFSKLAAPLYRLISKERKFDMLKQDKEALDELKLSLIETTMLVHFNPKLRKKISVDASDYAIGGILLQEDEEQECPEQFEVLSAVPIELIKCWKPVSFFSQKIAKHQISYSVSEKECLGILIGINKFKHYLEGDEFLIETDHHALCQLPKLKFKNQRLERWTIMLSAFKFKVIFTKGKVHGPDCLSRFQNEWDHRKQIDPEQDYIENLFYCEFRDEKDELSIQYVDNCDINEVKSINSVVNTRLMNSVYHYQVDENWRLNLISEQRQDDTINDIILQLVNDPKSVYHQTFVFINNLLFKKPSFGHDVHRIVINYKMLNNIFREEHSSPIGGHFGLEKTYLQIARRFWMTQLYEHVKEMCNNCQRCYVSKSTNRVFSEPSLKPIPKLILDRLEMDAQGPITLKGGARKIILVSVDTLSRYVYARLLPNQNAQSVQKFLNEYFSLFGYPSVIQTDRGRNFLSGDIEKYLKTMGIQHDISNSYHPQSQGVVERMNRNIAERLRTAIIDKDIVDLKTSLEEALIAINSSIHKIHRYQPYYLVFGKEFRKPIDLQLGLISSNSETLDESRMKARERLKAQQKVYQKQKMMKTLRNPYSIGDLCYVKNSAPSVGTTKKLVCKYFGPFIVLGEAKGSLLLHDPKNNERFSVNMELTKPYLGRTPEELRDIQLKLLDSESLISTRKAIATELNEFSLNESNNINQSDCETIPEDDFELNEQVRKRKRYITANRQIMLNPTLMEPENSESNGPITRNRKKLTINLISFKYHRNTIIKTAKTHRYKCISYCHGEKENKVSAKKRTFVQLSCDPLTDHTFLTHHYPVSFSIELIQFEILFQDKSLLDLIPLVHSNNCFVRLLRDIEEYSCIKSIDCASRLFKLTIFTCVLLKINFHTMAMLDDSDSSSVLSDNTVVDSIVYGRHLNRKLREALSEPRKKENHLLVDLTEGSATPLNPLNSSSSTNTNISENKVYEDLWSKLKVKDPLPKSTALGLRTIDKFAVDKSIYPPPAPNQPRTNADFPAPKPADETELPHFVRMEFFEEARELVKKDIEQEHNDKTWFTLFIKEKIQLNAIDTNLDEIDFDSLKKGLSGSYVIHPEFSRLKEMVTCHLCEQIAILPKSCSRCPSIYCLSCIKWLNEFPGQIGIQKIGTATQFFCLSQRCIVAVDSNGYPEYTLIDKKEIVDFYNNAIFKCNRKFCGQELKINNVFYHMHRCRLGPIDFSFDKTLQLPFIAGPLRIQLNAKPKLITALLPAHLKNRKAPQTLEAYWRQKALAFAFLVHEHKRDPNGLSALAMRAQANISNSTWNNYARSKDPTIPIDEGEQFVLKLGFPSTATKPIEESAQRWPTTRCSKIPHYLLNESIDWKRYAKNVDMTDGSIISSASSLILYSNDIDDPQSPFIRINPFERLAPGEAEEAQELLKQFPSCMNPHSIYKVPQPSTNLKTIQCSKRIRKRLNDSFKNRPKANLPPMFEDQLKLINDLSANCDSKLTTYAINMFFVTIKEDNKFMHRPCWVIIVDGNLEVVYETFVRYTEVDFVETNFHGLTTRDLRFARRLETVRDQVLKYLACANRIIGCGLINQLKNLGLSKDEINLLCTKFREVTNFYSPFCEHPLNLHSIAYLWFTGYTLPVTPHSPAVEAITAMRLYLLQWESFEELASEHGGIHYKNCVDTCGNANTSALLYDFDQKVKAKRCDWPYEYRQSRNKIRIPEYNDNCVSPSELILRKLETETTEQFIPSRMQKLVNTIMTLKRSGDQGDGSPRTKRTNDSNC